MIFLNSIFSILLLTGNLLSSKNIINQKYISEIPLNGTKEYKALKITPEVYNNYNLNDIRILDENGNEVPYFLNNDKDEIEKSVYEFRSIDNFIVDDYYFLDFEVSNKYDFIPNINKINLTSDYDKNYIKNIELFASDNLLSENNKAPWNLIENNVEIYEVGEAQNTSIELSSKQKYPYYRLKIQFSNISPKIDFMLEGEFLEKKEMVFRNIEESKVNYEIINNEEHTEININNLIFNDEMNNLKNIDVKEIFIKTNDNLFEREVKDNQNLRSSIYRLDFEDMKIEKTLFELEKRIEAESYKFYINNYNDRPLEIEDISITYYTDELIFRDIGSSKYYLVYGDENIKKPIYDIENFKEFILKEGYDILRNDYRIEPIMDTNKEQKKTVDTNLLLNIVIVVVAIFLVIIVIANMKKTKNSDDISKKGQ